MSHLETVQGIYQDFGSGNIPGILARIAPDAAWEQWETSRTVQEAGVPWLAAGTGPEAVVAFFTAIASKFDFTGFEVQNMLEGGNQVAATVKMSVTDKATGATFSDEEVQLWTFNEAGQVSGMRHYLDSARHIAAAG